MHSFTFDSISSDYFGLTINRKNIYVSPKRSQEVISVPGRDGDLIFDNGNYENVTISYTCSLTDTSAKVDEINEWLSKPGYKILSDTYDSTCFRKASVVEGTKITEDKKIGTFDLKFSCKPYKYLYSGETSIALNIDNNAKNINNPTSYSSLPLFEITASGPITLRITTKARTADAVSTNRIINFPTSSTKLIIDSELMAVYEEDFTLFNNAINFVDFPTFETGITAVRFQLGTGATLTSASVKPRWRKL